MSQLLTCTLCNRKFSEKDVENLNFFPDQLICFKCYDEGSKKEHRVWCFGKKSLVAPTGKVLAYGFDPTHSSDCRKHCPDRKVCFLFATGTIHRLRLLTKPELPFKPGSVSSKAFAACVLGTTRSKLRKLIRSLRGNLSVVMRRLKHEKRGKKTWQYIVKGERVRIKPS